MCLPQLSFVPPAHSGDIGNKKIGMCAGVDGQDRKERKKRTKERKKSD
jgi:hypothetical protein